MNFKDILNRLKNPGTIITLASLVILILTTNGVGVDSNKVMVTIKALCSIGVILGALNEPTSPGMDLPCVTKKDDKENK